MSAPGGYPARIAQPAARGAVRPARQACEAGR
jgi:hypothetical protein